jgi:hypothetical protein
VERSDAPAARRRLNTARSLAIDLLVAEVVPALTAAGVRAVLLKGATVASWLYTDGDERAYVDVDLWVAPAQFDSAEAVLSSLGFTAPLSHASALEQDEHARVWRSAGGVVDLHRTFLGIGASHETAWAVLTADTTTMTVGGAEVEALDLPARTLLVALHAAASGPAQARPLADLTRAVESVPEATWHDAAALARRVDALPALVAGLRLDDRGRALADRLGDPGPVPLDVALRAAAAPPLAVDLARLARTPGVGPKLRLAARKLVPTPALLRVWSPLARRGRLGLIAAYLWRPFVVTWRMPSALASLRRARVPKGRAGSVTGRR